MTVKPVIIRCTCCQSEVTMPQFYNGHPYGYVCIRKIDPAYKRTKVNYIPCESFRIVGGAGTTRLVVDVKVNGNTKRVACYGAASLEERTSNTYMQDGVLFVSELAIK